MWAVAELGQAERVDDVLVAEDVDRHCVLGLEAPDVPERDGERDAGHVDVVGDAVRDPAGVAADGVETGQDRPHETLIVLVAHVDDRIAAGELLRGRDVRRPV